MSLSQLNVWLVEKYSENNHGRLLEKNDVSLPFVHWIPTEQQATNNLHESISTLWICWVYGTQHTVPILLNQLTKHIRWNVQLLCTRLKARITMWILFTSRSPRMLNVSFGHYLRVSLLQGHSIEMHEHLAHKFNGWLAHLNISHLNRLA